LTSSHAAPAVHGTQGPRYAEETPAPCASQPFAYVTPLHPHATGDFALHESSGHAQTPGAPEAPQ
jgi:hypothetical protein